MLKDNNLLEIKNTIEKILPGSREFLFGSRCRGDFDARSDYDVLVVHKSNLSVKEKRRYASIIRKKLAPLGIAIDVLVKTERDVSFMKDRIGSIVREALNEGALL